MKCWATATILSLAIVALTSASSSAGDRKAQPRRYHRGSFFETIIVRQKDGSVQARQVYTGYRDHFPTPAWLYYGYPHSGDGSVSPWIQ
ncbi:MAG TPA: hypothetical protein VL175_11740 [Pirellulales bacterium]|jgi:hypothetical protein|nr:hypothetical protein [Pirellulales bacterium]